MSFQDKTYPLPSDSKQGAVQQYAGTGQTRHCFTCNRHRAQTAGWSLHKRTRMWRCAECTTVALAKEAA